MRRPRRWTDAAGVLLAALVVSVAAPGARADEKEGVDVHYGDRGLEIGTRDGRYHAWFSLRAQFRLSYPFDGDPDSPDDFEATNAFDFAIRRARFKSGGNVYRPWLDYNFEYDIKNTQLLDLRFTLARWEAFEFRLGQWKAEYNRERRDSSSEQQLVDRSIVNEVFTIDRQPGLMLMGHVWRGKRADSRYFAAVLDGEGLGNFSSEGTPMRLLRWQWNFLGRDLPFSQSDVGRRPKPAASLAVAGVWNRSRYTSFSSSGGGELPGFPADVAERYDVRQAVAEAAWQQRGFSFQAEYHWKRIDDRVVPRVVHLQGAYAQAGYFFHGLSAGLPSPLEVAARVAFVDPDTAVPDDRRRELTFGANWFFAGHRNKLTVDTSHLSLETPAQDYSVWRVRLQWDVSF